MIRKYWRKEKSYKSPKNLLAEGDRVRNALIVAKSMLSRGSKIEDVIKITGLTEKEIKKYVALSFHEISKVKQIQLNLM